MISTFRGVRTHLEFKVPSRLCLERNNEFLTCFNPSECGISLSTSLSVSLFLSVTTYDATKNQFSPHVRFWSEYCYAELIFLGRSVSVHSKWEKTSSSQPLFHLYTLSLASKERDYNFFQTFEMKLPTLFSFLCYAYLKKRLSFF